MKDKIMSILLAISLAAAVAGQALLLATKADPSKCRKKVDPVFVVLTILVGMGGITGMFFTKSFLFSVLGSSLLFSATYQFAMMAWMGKQCPERDAYVRTFQVANLALAGSLMVYLLRISFTQQQPTDPSGDLAPDDPFEPLP